MKIINILWLMAQQAYYNKACSHDPTHPDLPYVLRKRSELADALRQAFV